MKYYVTLNEFADYTLWKMRLLHKHCIDSLITDSKMFIQHTQDNIHLIVVHLAIHYIASYVVYIDICTFTILELKCIAMYIYTYLGPAYYANCYVPTYYAFK